MTKTQNGISTIEDQYWILIQWKKYKVELIIAIVGFIFIHLFLFCKTYHGESFDATIAGQFGDFIGGYLGTMFALISVILLYSTLKNQSETAEREKFENKFFLMLQLHRNNVSEIGIAKSIGRKVFVSMLREFREVLKITKNVCNEFGISYPKGKIIELAYLAFYYGVGPNSSRVLRNVLTDYPPQLVEQLLKTMDSKSAKSEVKKTRKFHYIPLEGHQSRLGHYFRHLYQTVKYVDEQTINIDKESYVKIVRAQLSNHEQAIFFFNSISRLGKVWRDDTNDLVTKYEFIRNLPKSFIDEVEEIDVKCVYPGIIFEWEKWK